MRGLVMERKPNEPSFNVNRPQILTKWVPEELTDEFLKLNI